MSEKNPHIVILRGHSDDILYIDGALNEELYPSRAACNSNEADEADVIALSDGTAIRVRYDEDGVWRLTTISAGPGTKVEKTEGNEDIGTDLITLTATQPFRWALLGEGKGLVKAHSHA